MACKTALLLRGLCRTAWKILEAAYAAVFLNMKGTGMRCGFLGVVLMCAMMSGMFAAAVPAAEDACAPKRLEWMLDEEQCGDLVFADVIEIMHTCGDPALRARAADGLGRFRGSEVFSALYYVLDRDRSPMVRAAALNALATILERNSLPPGRDIMEVCFLVYQFDRYAPNRAKAREMLERFHAGEKLLKERSYVSARYRPLEPLQVYASARAAGAPVATLQPSDRFAIVDESFDNSRAECWFSIETASGVRGWVCGLRDSKEYIGTDDSPPPPFESSVRSLSEIRSASGGVLISLRTSAQDDTFRPGDRIEFFLKAEQDCFVTLIYFHPKSGGYVLFPNRDQSVMRLSAGTEVRVPSEGSTLTFKASTPGVEEITAVATRYPVEIIPPAELEPGPIRAIKTGRQETARGIDRLLRYFNQDAWDVAHRVITVVQ